jgi:hypothetical protein
MPRAVQPGRKVTAVEFPLVFFAFGLVTPAVVMCFIGFYWNRSLGDDRVARAWQAYARRRRFTFRAPEGTWPNRTQPALHWTEDGITFRIEARGSEKITKTRVIARPAVAVLGELLVTRANGEAAGKDGAVPLDEKFIVWAQPAALADRVLTRDVKRALLGFDPAALSCRRGEVTITWPGGEENDARLDEASAVVRRILKALADTHLIVAA